MTLPNDQSLYDVRETERFRTDWEHGVAVGYINPVTDASDLLFYKRRLAERADLGKQLPDTPINLRSIAFPRIVGPPVIELWYSIVEDDRAVYLESIGLIQAG